MYYCDSTDYSNVTQQAKLMSNDPFTVDNFGTSVDIEGSIAVVGCPNDDDNGFNSGSVFVFTRSGTTWNQSAKLKPTVGNAQDYFGTSVCISGDTIVIGAPGYSGEIGAAYIFENTGKGWTQKTLLVNRIWEVTIVLASR